MSYTVHQRNCAEDTDHGQDGCDNGCHLDRAAALSFLLPHYEYDYETYQEQGRT
jgi:hypothetical protein